MAYWQGFDGVQASESLNTPVSHAHSEIAMQTPEGKQQVPGPGPMPPVRDIPTKYGWLARNV